VNTTDAPNRRRMLMSEAMLSALRMPPDRALTTTPSARLSEPEATKA